VLGNLKLCKTLRVR